MSTTTYVLSQNKKYISNSRLEKRILSGALTSDGMSGQKYYNEYS